VLQCRGLAEQAGAECDRGGGAERDSCNPPPPRDLVHEELRAERCPRIAGTCREHQPQRGQPASDRGSDIRRRDEGAEGSERETERKRSSVRGASRRGRPCDPADAEDDPCAAEQLARPDPLVEDPGREHEQQDDAKREDGLDEGQRCQRQRDELQRPAGGGERDCADPQRSPREAHEQRDLHRPKELNPASLERLQDIRDLVARGGAGGRQRAEGRVARHRCEDANVRVQTVAAVGAVGAASLWSVPAAAPVVPFVARAMRIPRRLQDARGVALTFDDGPDAKGTPAVLEQLERIGATATFFLVGEQVDRNPSLAAEIVAAGHEVALHGHRHRLHLLRAPNALADDLRRAIATVEDAVGKTTTAYRPPFGVFSRASLDGVRRSDKRPVLWSRWGRDWRASATPDSIARHSTANLVAGDIVLLHDSDRYSAEGSWRRTAAALPLIAESLAALGEPFVPVTQST
jgi:peptidoglycan/xylan/chitin deacetylase (PgdA/CDA1 family)